jgi:AraC family transcriptional regulator of arabinose operon
MEIISLPLFIEVDEPSKVGALFDKIISCEHASNLESLLMQKSYIFQLLAYYMQKSNMETHLILKDKRFFAVIDYIETHLKENITISDLADITHFNANYFIKFFKKITGVSPMEYILNCRINKAKRLLQTENLTMKEVAVEIGFKTSYYFSRMFKARTGFTPTWYRATAFNSPKE